ncbi:hypothetical protein niasHT_036321 [Heterodera trifolii]|uniref:Uncharacterized protein n=1 Tax=Heterodera trifolii TaxID=157864 RepID=A0ABD2HUM1_9BILA
MPSSNSFYVIVPSNTNVEGNRTNSFRVRLPRKLQFNSEWDVGLGVIIYPHSWPSLGTSEAQFVQIEWKIGENVQIPIPSSNVTNPIELWKSLYKLLEEGNKPLANKVEGVQKKFTEAANTARQLGRAEYIKKQQQQRDKRNVNDDDDDDDDKNEEQLLNALLAGVDTLLDLYGATSGGLLEREKRAATSKVPLKNWDDTDEEYQKKLDKYFLRLRGRNLERLEGLITEKLNAEIALMDDEERTILDQTKELGMTAWIKIFQSAYSACLLHFDNTSNRFSLKLDDRYVQKIKISDQLAYILGFNSTEFTEKETIAKFMPDMSGGVASFHVYAPDLIEPMMIGDVIAPVLRIVTIRGKPDEIIEEQFLSAQYHRVLVKEIRCFPSDQIPAGATTPVPYSMVINVDPTDSPGTHWVAVYCEQPNRVEYYDSTGIWPPFTNYRSKHHTHTLEWSALTQISPEIVVQYGGYNVFRGVPYQRGSGIGSVFRSLLRYLMPIGKEIGTAIGRQGLESGNRVLSNVLEGRDLKESIVSEGKSGLKNLLEKAANNINAQKGQGFDFKRYTKRNDAQEGGAIVPPTNVSVARSYFREVLPLVTITQESPYLFRLYSDNLWTDLSRIYLFLDLSIEKPDADGNWVSITAADAPVGTIQGIGQTFVQQLKVSVGNTEIYDSGNLYPYKVYITNTLSFPMNVKKSFLASTGHYVTREHDSVGDEGFKARCKIFEGGKRAQFLSRLDFDLGNQELYLLNNLDLLFTIYKARDTFIMQTLKANDTTRYRVRVHDVKLYAKMIDVQSSLNLSIYKTLEKQPATYAVRKTEIKSCFISEGRFEIDYNVFSATIPRRMTIALVANGAFNGNYSLSPFNFKPFDIRDIAVYAGGMIYPIVPYKLDFAKDIFVRPFVDMYEALSMANSERSFDITKEQFKSGWTFFVIPLTSTLDDSTGYELLRSGTTSIRATFNSAIPAGGVEMIVLGEFDQMIMIDYNRHIVSDSKLS